MSLEHKAQRFSIVDIALIKWSAMIFALFVVSAWQGFGVWVMTTPWAVFLIISLVLGVRPLVIFFKQS